MDALDTAIRHLGSQSALAAALGVAPQVVNNWKKRGNVPAEHCPEIEKVTHGRVRCEELRPDVDWSVLRNPTPTGTEQEPCMAFGEFGEPRSGIERRDGDRRQHDDPDFGDLGEPRDGERRQEDRRRDGSESEAAA